MTIRHAFVSLAAVIGLAACSDEDTIVSLNVTASDAVPVIDSLRVTFTQDSRKHVADFAPPTETPTAPEGQVAPPPSIKNSFFERITLPNGWSESLARVEVEALQSNGEPYSPSFFDTTTALIQPEGVVATYVDLDVPKEPPPTDGGAGGAGGESGGASSGGAGGTSGGDSSVGGAEGTQGGESAGGAVGGASGAGGA